ncbi:coproporphyrinogen dehydrogenase HemZ [Acetitomaculum ruminis]|nr:coproporphyrinogen dehydrogenase HemZ [Acetitomaculum ruminis]
MKEDEPSDMLFKIEYEKNEIIVSCFKNEELINSCKDKCDYTDKKITKNILKRVLYKCLSNTQKKELPWGTMTGIRPVRIVSNLLEEKNYSDNEIKKYLKDYYFVSDKKCDLAIEVAKVEKKVLDSFDYKKGYSLYIGIPFCPSRCLYCSFTAYSIDKMRHFVMPYIEALQKELAFIREYMDMEPDTIYVGGGTPTALNEEELEILLKSINNTFDVTSLREFCVEAGRPDSITKEKLRILKEYNTERISINPQSMNQKTLDIIGRAHSVADIYKTFEDARDAGFKNINMDMITGLPNEDEEDVMHTLECIKELSPECLTVHSLALKKKSRLNLNKEDYTNLKIINDGNINTKTYDFAKDMGMNPYYLYRQQNIAGNYENIGYSLPGMEGIYNILTMEERQSVLAAGAGSISKRVYSDGTTIKRCDNVKDIKLFIENIDEMLERKRELFKTFHEDL